MSVRDARNTAASLGTVTVDCLPQDWPQHLSREAWVDAIGKISAAGEALLDFAAMPPATFEQLCWWLLAKDHTLHGCQRLGVSGTGQGGIDLFAFSDQFPGKLNVYECKAWKNFDATRLSEAVTKFLNNEWAPCTRSFTLIVAQQKLGYALARRWRFEKQRLKEAGIEGDLWFADRLTRQVQAYPDIISKFFPGAHVEVFGNLWMQRVNFFEMVSKAVFDPRPAVANRAREIISGSAVTAVTEGSLQAPNNEQGAAGHASLFAIDGVFRRVEKNGRRWTYRGPWFSVSVMLPGQGSLGTTAAFDFNQGNLKGVTITVSSDWLLKRYLFSTGAPLTAKGRAFIVGLMPGSKAEYLIDFPGCRLSLEKEVVQEMANVADILTRVMRDELQRVEEQWSATAFPFVDWGGSRKVALACLRKEVWAEVCAFAEAYDYEKGSSPWHMFDGHPNQLRLWHGQANGQFDAGHHAVITSSKRCVFSSEDEVTLIWEPDGLAPDRALSPKGWWACQYTFDWLNGVLLPEVKRFVLAQEYGGRFKQMVRRKHYQAFSSYLDYLFVAKDLRKQPLLQQGELSQNILDTVIELQHFFAGARSSDLDLLQSDIENLYEAIAVLATGNRGFLGYVASSLGFGDHPRDHAQLISRVSERLDSDSAGSSASEADYALRAMLELLDDNEDWLTETQSASIKRLLMPLARVYDDAVLVERHTCSPLSPSGR